MTATHWVLIATLCISCAMGFSVSGNQILNSNGNSVLLTGFDRPSFEWNPAGEQSGPNGVSLQQYQYMAQWGGNAVRIGLNQDFWLLDYEGYVQNVINEVGYAKSVLSCVILCLHWSDAGNFGANNGAQQEMPDVNSVNFWKGVAGTFINDPQIIFELYNEPNTVSWSVWQNGDGGQWVGMQQLYDAVRGTGANNVVLIGGLNWAFDLSGVLSNPITGTNIAYSTHPYDYAGKQSGDWDAAFGYLAATYPVVMTEFGQYCNSDTYVSSVLAYATAKGIHWTAWAWYVNGCSFPSIIADWYGNPLGTVGQIVQRYLTPGQGGSGTPTTGGSGSTSTSGSTSSSGTTTGSSVVPASAPQNIYIDSLQNGWLDYSWGGASPNWANANAYSGSYSVSWLIQNYDALYLHTPNAFQIGSYYALQFVISSTVSNPTLLIEVYDNSGEPVQVGQRLGMTTAVTANQWTSETVILSRFGLDPSTYITGFAILYNFNDVPSPSEYVYMDSVILVPSAPSGTAAPSVPPTPTPSTASPSTAPTLKPSTAAPTTTPTTAPTNKPSTVSPTTIPTTKPATPSPTNSPSSSPTIKPSTSAPSSTPTAKSSTASPTTAPTTKPGTISPTASPSSSATVKPSTSAPSSTPTVKPSTSAPSSTPTVKPSTPTPTVAPTTKPATVAPTAIPTLAPATPAPTQAPSGGCSASNIQFTQAFGSSWPSNGLTISQYTVSVTHNCVGKVLVSLSFSLPSTWVPFNSWNNAVSGNVLTLNGLPNSPLAVGGTYSDFGYQNYQGEVLFTIFGYTFQ